MKIFFGSDFYVDSGYQHLTELQSELSRLKRLWTNNGKNKVESKADMKKRGVDSPNLADALVIAMSIKKLAVDPKPIYYQPYVMGDPGVGN